MGDATPSRLRPVTDVSPSEWLVSAIGPFGSGVGGLLPRGIGSYARILHPATSATGEAVRWATVAAWSGGTVHPRVQFEALARPRRGAGRGLRPWEGEPEVGELDPALLSALCERLAAHTRDTNRCWFCLWDGWGWIDGSPSVAWLHPLEEGGDPTPIPPAFGPAIMHGPRVRLPGRDYILLEGPLDAASELGWRPHEDVFDPQSPNLFWPDDRAWCVASEIDLDSTYVGGSAQLVDELLSEPRFEALAVDLGDSVAFDSDDVNR